MSVVAAEAQPRIPDVENELWLAPALASHPTDFLLPFRSFLFDSSRMPSGALHSGSERRPMRMPGRVVALTFDDGPHPEWTPAVLETLSAMEVQATFFVVGRAAVLPAVSPRAERGPGSWSLEAGPGPVLTNGGSGRLDSIGPHAASMQKHL